MEELRKKLFIHWLIGVCVVGCDHNRTATSLAVMMLCASDVRCFAACIDLDIWRRSSLRGEMMELREKKL
jgi:hypothetical protein